MKGEAFYITSHNQDLFHCCFSVLAYHLLLFFFFFFFFTDDTLGLGFEAMVQALLPGQCIMNLIILL